MVVGCCEICTKMHPQQNLTWDPISYNENQSTLIPKIERSQEG